MPREVVCPFCHETFAVKDATAETLRCPACGVSLPSPGGPQTASAPPAHGPSLPCPMCGHHNAADERMCPACGEPLGGTLPWTPRDDDVRRYEQLVQNFRRQSRALGGCWIGVGVIAACVWLVDLAARGGQFDFVTVLCGVLTAIGFGLGVFVWCKNLTAIRLGLVLSYLTALAVLVGLVLRGMPVVGLFVLFVLFVLLVLPVILQSHRVLDWAREMQTAGLPLSIRPKQIRRHLIETQHET
ncbi:MAG: hypothetical protein ACREJB_15310 [Planctomycetaceae bacterium]